MSRSDDAKKAPTRALKKEPNTFKFLSYAPERDSTTAHAFNQINGGVSIFDQLFLTPVRVITWVIGLGTASALAFVAPVWISLAVLGALIITASILRGAFRKNKDVISLLKKTVPEFEAIALETELESINLYSWRIVQEASDNYFFMAVYEKDKKYYVSKIKLEKSDLELYKSRQRELNEAKDNETKDSTKKAFEALLETLKKAYLQKIVLVENEQPSKGLKQFWLNLKTLHRNTFTEKTRLGNVKKGAEIAFNFVFNGAMVYWVVWSLAALTGLGFIGMGLAIETLLPFSSIAIAFGIPLALGVGFLVARFIVAYRARDLRANTDEMKNTVELLLRAEQSKQKTVAEITLATTLSDQQRQAIENQLEETQLPKINPKEQKSWLPRSIVKFFRGDYSLANATSRTPWGNSLRFIAHVAIRAALGFILGFIAVWPIADFVHFQFAIAFAGPLLIGWVSVALAMGFAYAVVEARRSYKNNQDYTETAKAVEANPMHTRLLRLELLLNQQRKINAALRQRVGKILAENPSKTAEQEEFKAIKAIVVAHDSLEFMEKFNTEEKSIRIKAWTVAKKFFNRLNEFVGAAGSGMLLVRLSIMAATAFAGINLIGPPAMIALGVFGGIWAVIRLCKFLNDRNDVIAKRLLNTDPNAAREIMENNFRMLKAQECRLQAIESAINTSTLANTNVPIPAAIPPQKDQRKLPGLRIDTSSTPDPSNSISPVRAFFSKLLYNLSPRFFAIASTPSSLARAKALSWGGSNFFSATPSGKKPSGNSATTQQPAAAMLQVS